MLRGLPEHQGIYSRHPGSSETLLSKNPTSMLVLRWAQHCLCRYHSIAVIDKCKHLKWVRVRAALGEHSLRCTLMPACGASPCSCCRAKGVSFIKC